MPSKGAPNMLPNVLPHAGSDHVPVLAEEVRELLAVRPGDTVVDATFGAGGHARVLAQDLAGSGKLVAIDRDPGAKPYFDRFKAGAGVEVRFLRGDFALVLSQLAGAAVGRVLRQPSGMFDAAENVFRLSKEDASRVRERHVMAASLEQRHTDVPFELSNLLAQRRLRRVQAGGGAREVQLLGHRHEVFEMPQFHLPQSSRAAAARAIAPPSV